MVKEGGGTPNHPAPVSLKCEICHLLQEAYEQLLTLSDIRKLKAELLAYGLVAFGIHTAVLRALYTI